MPGVTVLRACIRSQLLRASQPARTYAANRPVRCNLRLILGDLGIGNRSPERRSCSATHRDRPLLPLAATAQTGHPGCKRWSTWCLYALHQPCLLNSRSAKCTHPWAVAHTAFPSSSTQQRGAQMPLDARNGRSGVYVGCISRACCTVAPPNVPKCSVHLLPTHQDSHTRRFHRRTLSLICFVVYGPLQGRAWRCGGRTAKRAESLLY